MPTYAPPRSGSLRSPPPCLPDAATRALPLERGWVLVALVLVGASVLLSLDLGHSSLFIDEVYSWRASRGSLGDLADALRYSEVTPPLYYLLLHAWMQLTGGDSEVLLRIPSVLAGLALVAAVHWLGCLVAGRTAGLVGAALAATSPIVLLYAQQARAYVFVMLALTVAVAAVLQGTRDRSVRWLLVGGIAAAAALLLHYTSLLVLGPLVAWMWREPIALRWRLAFVGALALVLAAVAPLAILQLGQGHQDASGTYASLTTFNALRIAGTPFDGRATDQLALARELGAVVVVDALALLAFAERLRATRARWLIVVCGLLPLVVVAVFSVVAHPIALTRYTAVAAPFIVVAIGAVVAQAQQALAAALLVGALIASGAALVAAQRADGRNPDTRTALATVAGSWHEGDVVASVGLLGFDGALSYYGDRYLPPGAREVLPFATLEDVVADSRIVDAVIAGHALWLVADPPASAARLRAALGPFDYRVTAARTFAGNAPVQLVRAARSPES